MPSQRQFFLISVTLGLLNGETLKHLVGVSIPLSRVMIATSELCSTMLCSNKYLYLGLTQPRKYQL